MVSVRRLLLALPGNSIPRTRINHFRAKLAGSLGNLELWPDSQVRRYTEHKLATHLESIEFARTNNELLILEATAALSYFKAWQEIPVSWASKSEPFIPRDWAFIAGRESKVSGKNRNASHPINAILNYAYGLLESQVRIACAVLGLDTRLSYLHAMQHSRESLIFDLMEPLRPRADQRVIEFIRSATFIPDDFSISMQGVCKLNPQMARRAISWSLPDLDVQMSVTRFRDDLLNSASANGLGLLS